MITNGISCDNINEILKTVNSKISPTNKKYRETVKAVFNKYKEAELEKVNNYYMNNDIVNVNNLLTENNNFIESISKESEEQVIE